MIEKENGDVDYAAKGTDKVVPKLRLRIFPEEMTQSLRDRWNLERISKMRSGRFREGDVIPDELRDEGTPGMAEGEAGVPGGGDGTAAGAHPDRGRAAATGETWSVFTKQL
jgi:hypothetical protein